MSFRHLKGAKLSAAVDWRDEDCVTPVKDQGLDCKASWAFSAVSQLDSTRTSCVCMCVKLWCVCVKFKTASNVLHYMHD